MPNSSETASYAQLLQIPLALFFTLQGISLPQVTKKGYEQRLRCPV